MPSYLHNNGYGYANIYGGFALVALGFIFVGLRIWSRMLKNQKLQANDWFAILGHLFNTAFVAHCTYAVVVLGLGQDVTVIGPAQSREILQALLGLKPEWAFANACIKLSILHFYTMVFTHRPWFKLAARIVMVLAVLYSLAALLEIYLSCFPIQKLWDQELDGKCIDLPRSWLAVGLTNMIEDIIIIVLPLPVLWTLKLSLKRKIALTAIFSLGFIIIAVTAIRIKVIVDFNPANISKDLNPVAFWSMMEPALGVINCCLPLIQPAISRLSSGRLWTLNESRGDSKAQERSRFSSPAFGGRARSKLGREPEVLTLHSMSSSDRLNKEEKPKSNYQTSCTRVQGEELGYADTGIESGRIVVQQEWDISSRRDSA